MWAYLKARFKERSSQAALAGWLNANAVAAGTVLLHPDQFTPAIAAILPITTAALVAILLPEAAASAPSTAQ